MRIRYVGPGQGVTVRVVGDWVWRPENGYVCEVKDALSAANLMTLQGFDVAEDEPLVALVGREHTFELALAGVASVGDLVALDEDGIVNAALVCCVSREEVIHWVDVAGGRKEPGAREPRPYRWDAETAPIQTMKEQENERIW